APGHAAGAYLALLSRLAAAQAEVARGLAPAAWPDGAGDGPPLDHGGPWPEDWPSVLAALLAALVGEEAGPVRAALAGLAQAPPEALEAQARRLLAGEVPEAELAAAPFLGAALQLVFTSAAAAVPAAAVPRAEAGCPVCGGPPAVGVVLGDDKLRYLVCGLCATAWHHTRVQCVLCRSAAGLSYLEVAGGAAAAKAEACDPCGAWLKLLYVERAPGLEPLADDVATLALDLLMAERGLARLGRNPLLVHQAA
ncbi:MAG: formate dehydrogenase accessory protein FdhE, partial [Anaeromyxobacteraceae bacterium]|nr:formate dehydrogenase accessory protein FdhE [Anaeromyxobacteraceae bacterium]